MCAGDRCAWGQARLVSVADRRWYSYSLVIVLLPRYSAVRIMFSSSLDLFSHLEHFKIQNFEFSNSGDSVAVAFSSDKFVVFESPCTQTRADIVLSKHRLIRRSSGRNDLKAYMYARLYHDFASSF